MYSGGTIVTSLKRGSDLGTRLEDWSCRLTNTVHSSSTLETHSVPPTEFEFVQVVSGDCTRRVATQAESNSVTRRSTGLVFKPQ